MGFTDERNVELMRAFKDAITKSKHIVITEISEIIVNTPCSRFWVSEERAMVVVAALMRGKDILHNMRATKREMYTEIYARVIDLQKQHPHTPLLELVTKVVNSPAPKFYMRPRCAMEIIYKIKKGFYGKQRRRY